MISEEDKQRYTEAAKCHDCISWHQHCKAECCKIIFLNIDPKELEKGGKLFTIRPQSPLSFSDRRYYQLRDVECIRGVLRFKKERIIVVGRKVMYVHPCSFLNDDLSCKGHPNNKPELCKVLTLETAKISGNGYELTDNCLFKYKCKEVIEDAK